MTTTDSFKRVYDSRQRRVRGLWLRNGTYYAQMRVAGHKNAVKLKLQDATTVPQATTAMQALKAQRGHGKLVIEKSKGVPSFAEAAADYLQELKDMGSKKPCTIRRESSSVDALKRAIGEKPVNKVTMADAFGFASTRRSEVSGRAVDIDIITLRHVLNKAKRDGHVNENPIGKWSAIADPPAKVRLVTKGEINAMCAAAIEPLTQEGRRKGTKLQNGQRFSDFLRLLSLCGGREQETLSLRWSAVDWERKLLGFGQAADTAEFVKFSMARWVPLNPGLETHLKAMLARKSDSEWMFPSRMSGGNLRVLSYKKALEIVMKEKEITDFGFHHLRHYFISHCVMSKVDFKTIAEWVGHHDGGVLIGRVYSHLNDEHSTKQAALVRLT